MEEQLDEGKLAHTTLRTVFLLLVIKRCFPLHSLSSIQICGCGKNAVLYFKWNSIFKVGVLSVPFSGSLNTFHKNYWREKRRVICTGKYFPGIATFQSLGSDFLASFTHSWKQEDYNKVYKSAEALSLPPISFSWTSIMVRSCWHTGGLSLMSSTTTWICKGLSTSSPLSSFDTAKNVYCKRIHNN